MSRTLFWYILRDLLRIFLLASGVIAGIMSFGGLLKPLTHNGLEVSQVGKVLTFLMPAMTTYSLPIAALFATTIVYGRLSADNELTACRAAGISHLSIATPAMLLGLGVAITSLLFLCFIVPVFTLRVERVINANLAQILATQINRSHKLPLGRNKPVVFAQQAYLTEPDASRPGDQCVVLLGPTIISYSRSEPGVPREFLMAQQATIYIRQSREAGDALIEARLDGGIRFPRKFLGGQQVGIGATQFGPVLVPSPVRENTKFMDILRLKKLYANPDRSQRVQKVVQEFIRDEQSITYLDAVASVLNGPERRFVFSTGSETFELSAPSATRVSEDGHMTLKLGGAANRQVQMIRRSSGAQLPLTVQAASGAVRLFPDNESSRLLMELEFEDAVTRVGEDAIERLRFVQAFSVPMPASIKRIQTHNSAYYAQPDSPVLGGRDQLRRALLVTSNSIIAELHARASFAISCLILVMVGCALGMMFKSGNFLSAFAVSIVPALLCITLIGAGQQTAENIPHVLPANFHNPLELSLSLIWSGNVIVLVIATTLLWRLQRQ